MSKRNKIDDKARFVRLDRKLVEEISNFLFALGNQFINIKNLDGAFDCFKYSLNLNKSHQPSVYNLGALYNLVGNVEYAYNMFEEAVRMRPDDRVARTALGDVARRLGKLDESRKILEQVYKEDPDDYVVMSSLAVLNYDCGRLAEASEWNEKALEKKRGDVHMLLNRALINMTFGRWADWWGQYEFCLSYQKNERMRGMRMSDAWAGQELEGKSILVISDQGSGDAIQFSRYLVEVKERGKFGKLIFLVQPELKELLARVRGIDEIVGFGERMKVDFDAFSSLLGVMRVLRISPSDCWRPEHIVTDQHLDEVWRCRVDRLWDGRSKKIGIVWAGDPRHGNDHARSIPLTQFLKIVNGTPDSPAPQNVQLFSFQVGSGVNQLAAFPDDGSGPIVDLGSDFRNFNDTASAIRQMDLIISCDTSVVHLAGCMGVPTWVLIPNPPEWRWLTDVGTTNWYKSVRIFRQQVPRDWDSVFVAVLRELRALWQN